MHAISRKSIILKYNNIINYILLYKTKYTAVHTNA